MVFNTYFRFCFLIDYVISSCNRRSDMSAVLASLRYNKSGEKNLLKNSRESEASLLHKRYCFVFHVFVGSTGVGGF